MALDTLNIATLPSGIHAGNDLSRSMLDALENHAGVPLTYQHVIEEGSYEDFKQCVFRVLSVRICEIELDDMVQECAEQHIICSHQQREWRYAQHRQCVTTVQMRFQTTNNCSIDLQEFFHYLSRKYHFGFNKICVSRPARPISLSRSGIYDAAMYAPSQTELEVEILWRYWT
jgi:hypothetical protein